jgi:hypothetical protein
MASCIIILM